MKVKKGGSSLKRFLARVLAIGGIAALGGFLFLRHEFMQAAEDLSGDLEKLKALGVPTAMSDIKTPSGLTWANNAAPLYRDFQAEVDRLNRSDFAYLVARAYGMVPEDKKRIRKGVTPEQATALLPLVREAADREHCWFYRDWYRGYELLFPEYADMKTGAKALAVSAEHCAEVGRPNEALADLSRVQRIGMHAAEEPVLIGLLVGFVCDSIACSTAQRLATLWSDRPELLEELRQNVESWPAPRTIYHALSTEVAGGLLAIQHPNFFRMLLGTQSQDTTITLLAAWKAMDPVVSEGFKGKFASLYADMLTEAKLAGSEDWRALRSVFARSNDALGRDSSLPNTAAKIMAPVFEGALDARTTAFARRAITVGLIMKLQGQPNLPNDPFADKPVLVRNEKDGFVVYSVGSDLKDDGGVKKSDSGRDLVARFPETGTALSFSR